MASAAITVTTDSTADTSKPSVPPTIPLGTYDEPAPEPSKSKLHTDETQRHPQLDNPELTSSTGRLITSPYTTPEHLLDLSTLDAANQFLAKALTTLTPTRPDYATAPYTESFNWGSVFETLHDLATRQGQPWTRRSFYVVVFRSLLRADADGDRLHLLDERSHAEAVASGGLLKYWFGVKNEKTENLATCVWRSREDARAGGTGPWHAQARGAAKGLYERIEFTTLELVVGEQVGNWEFREWRN
ncbi:hypothetical protein BDW62DRAFT_191021 [Aspergillus aurantiobrunneus]